MNPRIQDLSQGKTKVLDVLSMSLRGRLAALLVAVATRGVRGLVAPRGLAVGGSRTGVALFNDLESQATPLSDSFDGAVQDAWRGLKGAMDGGALRLRLDFDTSMGDATYTQLKLSMDFARDVAIEWALELDEGDLVLFFPDSGAAALARQEWKMEDLDEALVPPNVRVAGFPRDTLEDSDAGAFARSPALRSAGCAATRNDEETLA